MAELIYRLRAAARPGPGARGGDLAWLLVVGGSAALVVGYVLTISVQATCALVAVAVVIALAVHDRRSGIIAVFVLWFVAPMLRRVFGLITGYVGSDPLSVAPFVATAAVASFELLRVHVPTSIRRIGIVAAAGFAFGLPAGLLLAPQAAMYALVAYLAGVLGIVLGLGEPAWLNGSTLRRVLLFGLPPIAAYAVLQRLLPLTSWDQAWVDAANYTSIGVAGTEDKVRVFGSLNGPGVLAPLLALSLLTYLTVDRARTWSVAGAALIAVALSLTLVRSAWVSVIVAAVAHVVASNGRSARLVFGAAGILVAATLALAPVSSAAQDVLDRFNTIGGYKTDTSANDRSRTLKSTLPEALRAPIGHGLGSAGEPSKLAREDGRLRTPDNGYLSLLYQVGLVGFLLVAGPILYVLVAAWQGARARAPGQELRLMLFALLVYLLVQLWAGDALYGVNGVVFWFVAGQVLAHDHRRRALTQYELDHRADAAVIAV